MAQYESNNRDKEVATVMDILQNSPHSGLDLAKEMNKMSPAERLAIDKQIESKSLTADSDGHLPPLKIEYDHTTGVILSSEYQSAYRHETRTYDKSTGNLSKISLFETPTSWTTKDFDLSTGHLVSSDAWGYNRNLDWSESEKYDPATGNLISKHQEDSRGRSDLDQQNDPKTGKPLSLKTPESNKEWHYDPNNPELYTTTEVTPKYSQTVAYKGPLELSEHTQFIDGSATEKTFEYDLSGKLNSRHEVAADGSSWDVTFHRDSSGAVDRIFITDTAKDGTQRSFKASSDNP